MYRKNWLDYLQSPSLAVLRMPMNARSYLRLFLPVVIAAATTILFDAATAKASDIGSANCTFSALQAAVTSGTVTFTDDCTITMTGQITVTNNLTITGSGFAAILSGSGGHRLFDIVGELEPGTRTVVLDGVTLQNGDMPTDDFANLNGGAIAVRASTHMTAGVTSLIIRNSTLRNNQTVAGAGGAISLVRSNFPPGAVPNLIVQNSTIAGNTAGTNTPAAGGGIYCSNCTMIITNTTIAGNTANGDLGGGGIFFTGDNLMATLTNSTLSSNTSSRGAGFATPTFATSLTITLTHVTIAANNGTGFTHTVGGGTVNAINTLITDNSGGIAGILINGLDTTNSVVASTPGLGPLADNGGKTQTHAINTFSSNAVDQGTNIMGLPTYDQRGAPFLRKIGSAVDIGAYEFAAGKPDVSIHKSLTPIGTVKPGQPITYALTIRNVGTAIASNVVSTDVVPIYVTHLAVASTTVGVGVAITDTGTAPPYVWTLSDLGMGDGGTITITGQISASLSADVVFTNTAIIGSTDDVTPTNNVSQAAVRVEAPRVGFSVSNYRAGERDGSATITVTLDGPNPYAPVQVIHSADSGDVGQVTIPAGAAAGAYIVPIDDDSAVGPDRTIQLSLSNPVGAALGPTVNATLTIVEDDIAGLRVSKTASLDTAKLGNTIEYTYRVTNTGNVNLTNLSANDDKLGNITLTPANLLPDQVASGVASYQVQQSDLPGPLENTVVVTALAAGGFTVTGGVVARVNLDASGNSAPRFSSTPIFGVAVGEPYEYVVTADDPDDGDILIITAPVKPAWLTFGDLGGGAATLIGTPASGDVGDHPVNLMVEDAEGASASQKFTITVTALPTGTVEGIVFLDLNGNDELDEGEPGVAEVIVVISDEVSSSATGASDFTDQTLTDDDGLYRFVRVPVGQYTLAYTPPPGFKPIDNIEISVLSSELTLVPPIPAEKIDLPPGVSIYLPVIVAE